MPYFVFVLNDGTIDRQEELPMMPGIKPEGDWHEVDSFLRLPRAHNAQKWQWNNGTPACVDPRSLDSLKAIKRAEITATKIALNADHFVYMEKKISVDEASFREMQATCCTVLLTQAMPVNWPGGWKTMDDSYVPISTVADWIAFFTTMSTTGITNFNKSQLLKARIADAVNAEELNAITWESSE